MRDSVTAHSDEPSRQVRRLHTLPSTREHGPDTHADNLETFIPLWLGPVWDTEAKLENSLDLGARQSQKRQAGPEPSKHTDFASERLDSCKQWNTEE